MPISALIRLVSSITARRADMKLILIIAALFLAFPALAEPAPPDPIESLAKDKIQFGQLLIQLGNAELEIAKLHKELDAAKPKDEPKTSHP